MAARPAGRPRHPAGDEARQNDPRPPYRVVRGAGVLQLPALGSVGERGGPAQGGAAPHGLPDPDLRRRPPGGGGGRPGGGPPRVRPCGDGEAPLPPPHHRGGGGGHPNPGVGERDRGLRPPDLRPAGGGHPGLLPREPHPQFLRRGGPPGHLRERGHGERLLRLPLRQGDPGLHQLPHDGGGVRRLLGRAVRRPGGGGSRL